jgi:hypothetical protein
MYGSSVAGGHGPVSNDSKRGADELQEEEKFRMPSLQTLKRKTIV